MYIKKKELHILCRDTFYTNTHRYEEKSLEIKNKTNQIVITRKEKEKRPKLKMMLKGTLALS